jgi:hypothetical protein
MEILKMKDKAESYRIDKTPLPDLPMRLLVIGKSQFAGKTNLLANLMNRPYDDTDLTGTLGYRKDFKGHNMYVVCPSSDIDEKWGAIIEFKEIPSENVYSSYDEEALKMLYDRLTTQYKESINNGEKPEHTIILFDDISSSGKLKSKTNGVIAELFQRGRHILCSTVLLAQNYVDIPTACRKNCTACIIFEQPLSAMEAIFKDHGKITKNIFIREFEKATKDRHTMFTINYSNPPDQRFLDTNFEPIAILNGY